MTYRPLPPFTNASASARAWVVAIFALTAVVYWPTLFHGWAWEDSRMAEAASAFDLHYTFTSIIHSTLFKPWSRDLTAALFAACWKLSGGQPWLFHLVSVLVHLFNGTLVYKLARRMSYSLYAWGPVCAAAVFLLHPIQAEAVNYAAVMHDLASTTCILLACLAIARDMGTNRLTQASKALVFAWLAVHFKESALGELPVIALTWWWAGIPARMRPRLKWAMMAAGATVVMAAIWMFVHQAAWEEIAAARPDYTAAQYMAGQTYQLSHLMVATIIPLPVLHSVDPDIYTVVARPEAVNCVVVILALVVLSAVLHCLDRRHFGIVWALSAVGWRFVVHLNQWVGEHHWYIAMVGISVSVSMFVDRMYKEHNDSQKGRRSRTQSQAIRTATVGQSTGTNADAGTTGVGVPTFGLARARA